MYNNVDQHHFYGTHAVYADELTSDGYFRRLVDLLAVAPLVGFEYKRRSERNNEGGVEKSMLFKQLQSVDKHLELDYKMLMLLDTDHEPDEEQRYFKAFQISPDEREKEDLEWFESYVRGGIEVLHESLIGQGNTQDDKLIELYDFVNSFSDRYNIKAE